MKIMSFNLLNNDETAVESTFEIVPTFGIEGFKGFRCSNASIDMMHIEQLVNLFNRYQEGPVNHYKADDAGHMTLVAVDTPYTGIVIPVDGVNRTVRIAEAE